MAVGDIRAGRAFVELFLKNSLTKGLATARKQLDSFAKTVTSIGTKLATMGATAAVPVAYMTKTFMDFDDAMRAVQAVTQSTDAQLASLTNRAKHLGATTSFTAIQVANLMTELGRAGFSAEQVEEMTGAVLDLSRATGTDATLASGIMAASIRQFGLAAGDATRVADALTMAANASFNSVETLGEALSYAGPVAADFNMSIEDTLAILGALGNVGIQGSNAGTAVRRLLTLSAAEADKFKEIFGVATKDAAGNARPLVDVLDEINKATANLGSSDRAAKFNEAFGLLGITSASAISKNAVSVKELQKRIYEAGGAAADAAKKMDAGLGGSFRIMLSAIEGVQIAVGEALAPMFMKWAKTIENVATSTIFLSQENQEMIRTVVKATAAITAGGVALIALGYAASAAAGAIGLITSPLALTTAALAYGVYEWSRWSESGRNATANIKTAWGGLVAAIQSGDLEMATKISMAGVQAAFNEAAFDIRWAWQDMVTDLAKYLADAMAGVEIALTEIQSTWQKLTRDRDLFAKQVAVDLANNIVKGRNDTEQAAIDRERQQVNRGTLDPRDTVLAAFRERRNKELDERQRKLDLSRKAEKSPEQIAEEKRAIARQYQDDTKAATSAREKRLRDIDSRASAAQSALEAERQKEKERLINDKANAQKRLEEIQAEQKRRAEKAALDAQEADLIEQFKEEARRKKAEGAGQVDTAAGSTPAVIAAALRPGGSVFGSFSANALLGQNERTVQDKMLVELKETRKLKKEEIAIDKKMLKSMEAWEKPITVYEL